MSRVARGGGREVERVDQSEGERGEGEDGDDADEGEGADAAGAHGGDLGVGGQAAEAEQNAGQHRRGDGDGEGVGQHVGEDAQHIAERGRVAHHQIEDLADVAHEQHEGEEHPAEQSVGDDFAKDVAGEDAHTVLGCECSAETSYGHPYMNAWFVSGYIFPGPGAIEVGFAGIRSVQSPSVR